MKALKDLGSDNLPTIYSMMSHHDMHANAQRYIDQLVFLLVCISLPHAL